VTPGLVSAIVVNWNGARLLGACLDALAAQDYRPLEIIVVDNGSTDGSPEIAAGRSDAQVIRKPDNLGFAVANNIGLQTATGEFIFLLNNDAVAGRTYVSTLVATLQADATLGSTSGKLVRPSANDAPRVIDSTGHVMYRNVWATNRGEGQPDGPIYDVPGEVFGVCAAAGMYRRAMLDDVAVDGEVFDATFFAYLEDVDLDWRARLRGWRSWYEPSAIAVHHRSASGGRSSIAIQRHIFKNRILMIVKNDGGPSLAGRLPGMVAFTLVQIIRGMIRAPAFVLAIRDVVRLLPTARHKRHQIRARRTSQLAALDRWFEPYPYLRKLRERRRGRSGPQWISQS
jgi:GT2 family glycosyltransferase